MQSRHYFVTLGGMFLLLLTASFIALVRGSTNKDDGVLQMKDNPCRPIRGNGKMLPTVPEYMPSFPVTLKGIKRQFVCKLSESTLINDAVITSTEDSTSTISVGTDTQASQTGVSTRATTTRDTTTMSTTDSTTNISATTSDLQDELTFKSIQSSDNPRYLTYDSVDKKIYWTDKGKRRVYRADVDGNNRETVTYRSQDIPRGIAIATSSRILYIAYIDLKKITTVSIGHGSTFSKSETNFESGESEELYSLEIDEEQRYLYWTTGGGKIKRKSLAGNGETQTVYSNEDLSTIAGLSIDLSRDPRRLFFCDINAEKTFYVDLTKGGNRDDGAAMELTSYLQVSGDSTGGTQLQDISYFNGVLYWTKERYPSAIAVMTNYDQNNRSYEITEISAWIDRPHQLLLTTVEP